MEGGRQARAGTRNPAHAAAGQTEGGTLALCTPGTSLGDRVAGSPESLLWFWGREMAEAWGTSGTQATVGQASIRDRAVGGGGSGRVGKPMGKGREEKKDQKKKGIPAGSRGGQYQPYRRVGRYGPGSLELLWWNASKMLPWPFQTRRLLPPLCPDTVGIRRAPPSLVWRLMGPELRCRLHCTALCSGAGEQAWLVGSVRDASPGRQQCSHGTRRTPTMEGVWAHAWRASAPVGLRCMKVSASRGANKLRSHNLCGWSHTKMGRKIGRVAAVARWGNRRSAL